jgi:hypothetical protein
MYSTTLEFTVICDRKFLVTSLNIINHMIFWMVKCWVFFEVRTEFLNIVYTSFSERESIQICKGKE